MASDISKPVKRMVAAVSGISFSRVSASCCIRLAALRSSLQGEGKVHSGLQDSVANMWKDALL